MPVELALLIWGGAALGGAGAASAFQRLRALRRQLRTTHTQLEDTSSQLDKAQSELHANDSVLTGTTEELLVTRCAASQRGHHRYGNSVCSSHHFAIFLMHCREALRTTTEALEATTVELEAKACPWGGGNGSCRGASGFGVRS